jgi:UDP:flavonoid glycosyltransferase YjiC (YdhE family)
MRVLCSTTPMEGVFAPFVPLGKALLAAGHEVLVVTGPDLLRRVAREGFATHAAGPTAMEGAIAAMGDPAVTAAPDGEPWHFGGAMFGAIIAPAKLPALREAAEQFRPDLIVHPPVDLAAPLLATQLGLPSVTYGFGRPMDNHHVNAFATRVAPLWEQNGLDPDPCAGLYRCRYLDPSPPMLQGEPTGADPVRRPLRAELPGDSASPLPGWASANQRPLVYLSLGTVPFFNQPDKFRLLLADLSKEDIEVAVTVGELNDPAALGEQPTNVHVERWLSLASLLPRCSAVVCHAGSGTTLAALVCGLPLVLVPQGADQFTNAAACEAAGVATVLRPHQLSSEAVRDAVRAVLTDGSQQAAAARRAANQIAAMPDAVQVAKDLQELVG